MTLLNINRVSAHKEQLDIVTEQTNALQVCLCVSLAIEGDDGVPHHRFQQALVLPVTIVEYEGSDELHDTTSGGRPHPEVLLPTRYTQAKSATRSLTVARGDH